MIEEYRKERERNQTALTKWEQRREKYIRRQVKNGNFVETPTTRMPDEAERPKRPSEEHCFNMVRDPTVDFRVIGLWFPPELAIQAHPKVWSLFDYYDNEYIFSLAPYGDNPTDRDVSLAEKYASLAAVWSAVYLHDVQATDPIDDFADLDGHFFEKELCKMRRDNLRTLGSDLPDRAREPLEAFLDDVRADLASLGLIVATVAAGEPGAKPAARHSEDFTSFTWNGKDFQFNKTQAACVKELAKGSLSEKTIGERIGTTSDRYRLAHTFRSKTKGVHPAWGTLIVACGKGIFQLATNGVCSESP